MGTLNSLIYPDESMIYDLDVDHYDPYTGTWTKNEPQNNEVAEKTTLVEIDLSDELKPGDEITIKIDTPGFASGLAKTIFEYKYIRDPRFTVTNSMYDVDGSVLIECRVNDLTGTQYAGVKITAGLIVTAIVGLATIVFSVSAYKTIDRVGEIVNTEGGKIAAAGISITAVSIAVVIGLYLYSKAKK